MKIVILGATIQIAQDLILSFSKNQHYDFSLFGRNMELLEKWINSENLSDKYQVQEYSEFSNHQKYDVIINFVGIGDPVKAKKMGSDIFQITEQYDNMALDYIKQHKETRYIFLSSGAVYGGSYQEPANENTVATVDINNLNPTGWYAIAKLYAEAKHRSLSNLSIVDVRVFNYFSCTQDMSAGFLITDLVRALKNNDLFITSSENIVRDFITPPDFFRLIESIINFKAINSVVDCYSKLPVDKLSLLAAMKERYGLRYKLSDSLISVNSTGVKANYFSLNKCAENFGYSPAKSSLESILEQSDMILEKHK